MTGLFEDVFGANRVGMRAVHLPLSTIPANQLGEDGVPDATIDKLSDLIGVIDGWLAAPAADVGTGDRYFIRLSVPGKATVG